MSRDTFLRENFCKITRLLALSPSHVLLEFAGELYQAKVIDQLQLGNVRKTDDAGLDGLTVAQTILTSCELAIQTNKEKEGVIINIMKKFESLQQFIPRHPGAIDLQADHTPKNCGCGNCTISKWITGSACPHPKQATVQSVSIMTSEHPVSEFFKLRDIGSNTKLLEDTNSLREKFNDYYLQTHAELQKTECSENFTYLFDHIKINFFPNQQTPSITTTHELISFFITVGVSWFNYFPVHFLVRNMKNPDTKIVQNWDEYASDFKVYCNNRRIKDLSNLVLNQYTEINNSFIVETDDHYDDIKLSTIELLRVHIAKVLGCKPTSFYLLAVKKDSLLLLFRYYLDDYLDRFRLCTQQQTALAAFRECNIISLKDVNDQFEKITDIQNLKSKPQAYQKEQNMSSDLVGAMAAPPIRFDQSSCNAGVVNDTKFKHGDSSDTIKRASKVPQTGPPEIPSVSSREESSDISGRPGQPHIIEKNDGSINIRFDEPTKKSQFVIRYDVLYCKDEESNPEGEWHTKSTNGKVETIIIENLEAETDYQVKVRAYCNGGYSADSRIQYFKTASQVPGPPGIPICSKSTSDTIALYWSAPKTVPVVIKKYEIHYCLGSNNNDWKTAQLTTGTELSANISRLLPGTKYLFKVRADCGECVFSPFSEVLSQPTQTKEIGIPSPMEPHMQLIETSVDNNSKKLFKPVILESESAAFNESHIWLSWNMPNYDSTCMSFEVMYTDSSSNHSNEWNKKKVLNDCTCIITLLSPYTEYIFKVIAISYDGAESDMSDPICIMTPGLQISPPLKIKAIEVSYNHIILKWSEPQQNSELVSGYEVKYYPHSSVKREALTKNVKTDTKVNISKLSSETKYIFRIKSLSSKTDKCVESEEVSFDTDKAVSGCPMNLKVKDYDHDSVLLKVDKPNKYSELVDSYAIFYSNEDESSSEQWPTYQKKFSTTQMYLTNLIPATQYSFEVVAVCKTNESSQRSDAVSVQLLTPIPGEPGKPYSFNISDDSLTLQWPKPKLYPQFVKHYLITNFIVDRTAQTVQEQTVKSTSEQTWISTPDSKTTCEFMVKDVGELREPSELSDEIVNKTQIVCVQDQTVKSTSERACMSMLDSSTSYKFIVKAVSVTGVGEPSEPSDQIVTLAPIPSKPGKPVSIKATHNEIGITWAKPHKHSSRISNYIVYYAYKLTDDALTKWCEVKSEEVVCTINELRPGTEYVFKVVATSKNGNSDTSDESDIILTLRPIPTKPGKPTCQKKTHDCITLRWEKPQQYAENVQGYEVTCFQEGNDRLLKTQTTNKSTETIEFISLDSQQGYRFQVKAKSEFGLSEESPQSDLIGTESQRLAIQILPSCIKSENEKKTSPPVYALQMEQIYKFEGQKLAKFQFSQPLANSYQKEKVLLIVGETGTGKTTLINGMVNYLFGVQYTDDFRLKLISESPEKRASCSDTKWITSYTFLRREGFRLPYNLTIIDTPGFGDTEGIEQDKQLVSQIKKFFNSGEHVIDHLDGVGFVVKSNVTRLTIPQKYVFNAITSMFAQDMKNNFFLLMTFADFGDALVLEAVKEAKMDFINETFEFNNSALYNKIIRTSENYWELGIDNFSKFFKIFETTSPVSLSLTQEVLEQREHLEVVICSLQKQIKIGMAGVENLKNHMKVLKEKKQDIMDNKEFAYETIEVKIVEIMLDGEHGQHVTHCLDCNMTCHYPCTIKDDGEKYKCAAMAGFSGFKHEYSMCEVCPKKCSWKRHRNVKYRLDLQTNMVTKTSNEIKARYDTAIEGESHYDNIVKNMEKELQSIFTQILDSIRKAHACTARLDEIALKRHPLNDLSYIDLLIDGEMIEQSEGYVARIKYYKEVREQARLIDAAGKNIVDNYSDEGAKADWWKTVLDTENELPSVILPSSGVAQEP